MAARNRKKKQGCVGEFLSPKKEDPWALVRKLEAQLAQEKFYHEKTKTESQYEIKTLQAKVRSLERQKKTFLEKLEQSPIEQQNKLEKELNDTSRQLRETTQKLAASQQAIDKLSRSNRGIKKAKEKMEEQFLKEIWSKNMLIHKLEGKIRDLKMPFKDNEAHFNNDPTESPTRAEVSNLVTPDLLESEEYWEPGNTVEMWDKSDDDITQIEREEKGRTKDQTNKDAPKTLEEKTQVEECKVSFFPSMYDHSGNEKAKQNPFHQKAEFQNLPTTYESNCNTDLNDKLPNAATQTIDGNSIMVDETQSQGFKLRLNEATTEASIQDTKACISNRKPKYWNKAKMDNLARQNAHKVCPSQACDCINRLRQFYSKITLGSKVDATQDIPDALANREVHKIGARPPPPGFSTMDAGPALHAGIDFLNPPCVQPVGNGACTQNMK